MISIEPTMISDRDNHKLMSGSVVPRPVAFVTTLSKEGVVNGAPFSYYSVVSGNPPLLTIAVGRRQGRMKDTARNAVETGSFVVHAVDLSNVEKIDLTAAGLPPDESEVEQAGLTTVPSVRIPVPGVLEAKIRMECELERVIPLGGTEDEPTTDLLIGRVVYYHFAEEVYDNGYVLMDRLQPVSRLAGSDYAAIGRTFVVQRPQ